MPSWRKKAQVLPEPKEFRFDDVPELQPLFEPQRNRSVLSSALSTRQSGGELDLDAIVHRITTGQPIVDLPRLPEPTTRLGLQLLIDRGRGLLPYHRDQDLLLTEVAKIVGRDRVQALRFSDSPLRGVGHGPRIDWTEVYQSPAPGVPVVVLSDLGIARNRTHGVGAPVEEWLRFVRRVRAGGCPLLAIVPAFPERLPRALHDHFCILPWSRTTTIATVRGIVGRGLETKV